MDQVSQTGESYFKIGDNGNWWSGNKDKPWVDSGIKVNNPGPVYIQGVQGPRGIPGQSTPADVRISKTEGNALSMVSDGLLYVPPSSSTNFMDLPNTDDDTVVSNALQVTPTQAGIVNNAKFHLNNSRYKLAFDSNDIIITKIPAGQRPKIEFTSIGFLTGAKKLEPEGTTTVIDLAVPVLLLFRTTGDVLVLEMSAQIPPAQFSVFRDDTMATTFQYPLISTSVFVPTASGNYKMWDDYTFVVPAASWNT